jgi:uncharacterized protein (TIGR01732 family)
LKVKLVWFLKGAHAPFGISHILLVTGKKEVVHMADGVGFAGGGFALIVVLFILLIIVGAAFVF